MKAKFFTPPNKIKQKVGGGGIAPQRLHQAQEYINNNSVDFIPHARTFLDIIKDMAEKQKDGKDNSDTSSITVPIMNLKANGGMFRYHLISEIADICLNFVESIETINNDAYDVIQAHANTINIIIANKMLGHGGKEGKALIKELEKACHRYMSKHPDNKKSHA